MRTFGEVFKKSFWGRIAMKALRNINRTFSELWASSQKLKIYKTLRFNEILLISISIAFNLTPVSAIDNPTHLPRDRLK